MAGDWGLEIIAIFAVQSLMNNHIIKTYSMKHFFSVALLSFSALLAPAENPLAQPGAVVEDGNARFTVLTPEMIRIEYSPAHKFEDRATFAVVNRNLPVPEFTKTDDGTFLTIATDELTLKYRKGTDPLTNPPSPDNLTISMKLGDKDVVWYPGLDDPQNLRGTYRTLDRNNGDDYRNRLEQGVISRSGWAVIDDSPAAERADGSRSLALESNPGGIDWVAPRADADALDLYFMGYGHDYKKALYDFTRIAGKIPLPPDYVLGYWYSKYDEYTADDFRNIVKAMADNDINADVLILDMDWHWNGREKSGGRGGWTGWSWNTNLIPDPDGLLNDIHKAGLRAALNLHPADGVDPSEDQYALVCSELGLDPAQGKRIPWQLEDKKFAKAFFNNIIRPLEKQGVDFWWLDWQQKLVNDSVDGLGQTIWCNHVFFNDMKHARPDRRPVIFHRWGGLGSHRYQIGFSGDTFINFPTLAFEPYFTATASNVGYAYWGHDLGGHMIEREKGDPNDPELLTRWMQFGVFTPVFRTHATNDPRIERRIWTYENFDDLNATVKLRYAIFPYLYTMARKTYDTGIGMVRPMYYEYPDDERAYTREGQYYFGDDIIVAPVVTPSVNGISTQEVWLPDGAWWSPAHAALLQGDAVHTLEYTLQQIPYFIRQGSIIANNPPEVKTVTARSPRLILNVIGGADGRGELYEDAGDSNDYDTAFTTTAYTQTAKGKKTTITIEPRRGAYPGMPAERAYQLRYYGKPVAKATVNGKKAAVAYDPATACSTIEIPALPCSAKTTVALSI